jgi:two-component system, NarL family, nitrate/nitrite response regulator NarL
MLSTDRRTDSSQSTVERAAREAITVLAADRQPLFREAVSRALRRRPGLQLIGTASEGWAALKLIREERPQVAVVAVDLDGIDGRRLLNAVVRDDLPTRILLLGSSFHGTGYDAIAAGAAGWVSHATRADELCDSIAAVARGQMVLPAAEQATIVRRIREGAGHAPEILNARERDLIRLLADGRSPTEIGRSLHLSPGTVKSTLLRLYKRLGVADRAALVALGLRRGWIE